NKAYCETVGLSNDAILGKTDYDLFPKEIADQYNSDDRKVLDSGQSEYGIEEQHKKPSGEYGWSVTDKLTYIDDQGNIAGTIGFALDITARKRAEEALRESEERFRILSEAAFEAIVIHEDGVLLNANDQYFKMFGYEPGEALGKEMISVTIAPEAIEFVEKQMATDGLGPYESIGIRKDGTRFPMEARVRKMEYKGRNVRFGAIVDITERKRAEEVLRDSETKFRTLFESANDAIFMMDQDIFVDCNSKTLEMFDCTREQIIGQPPYLFSPEVQPDGRNSMEKAKEKIETAIRGQAQFFEWKHSRYDGTLFDAEVSLNALSIEGKYYLQATVRDITERKRIEEALRESEQSLRLSEEQLLMAQQIGHTGSWIYNIETNKIWGSTEGLRIFGYPPVARDWPIDDIEACIPERDRVHQALVALISEGREYNLEYAINPADGSPSKVIHSIARLEKDAQGNPLKVIGFLQDITDRKQMEEERKVLQERLQRAEKMEALGTLAGGVAHDLNNVLGLVVGY
ncbi:MAG: PAS domain S-box protein, partial [Syntrophales bacterium LBB04]|nr:PAS domain S-box protein [Syntrophales bacterium LBB04]